MSNAVQHSQAFKLRRFFNWFPMGLAYALLYMGRYNLTVAKNELGSLMTKEDFGVIFGIGALVYGVAFIVNGPMVDRIGGRLGILIATLGAGLMNLAMGLYLYRALSSGMTPTHIRLVFMLLYSGNMYFQSFGAVSIVKVNAHWFHIHERGGFSGIFGTMIASGLFLAFTVNSWMLGLSFLPENGQWFVFFVPAGLLLTIFLIEIFLLKDSPSKAGYQDFDTGDASSGEEDKPMPVFELYKRILTNPVIITVALIEFCTGVLRNGVMHWIPFYLKEVWGLKGSHMFRNGEWTMPWLVALAFAVAIVSFVIARKTKGRRAAWLYIFGALAFLAPFVQGGWGGLLFVAGVIGGNVAGWVSDLFFQSRRAPAAGGLYGLLVLCVVLMFFAIKPATTQIAWSDTPNVQVTFDPQRLEAANLSMEQAVEMSHRALAALDAPQTTQDLFTNLEPLRNRNGWKGHFDPEHRPDPDSLATLPIGGDGSAVTLGEVATINLVEDGLWPGDTVIAIAGVSELEDWEDVVHAVQCIPATCEGASTWDTSRCLCATRPEATRDDLVVSTGVIQTTVLRGGTTMDLEIRDPRPTQTAGDERRLAAGPAIPISPYFLGFLAFLLSVCVIGAHGLLSGTATMDFGGRRGAGTAVGVIDGFVYLGTFVQAVSLGFLTTKNWICLPLFLIPFSLIGFYLLTRIWHAKPKGRGGH
ncbi:MAG: MFS transporter [Bradymonadales bacterium]|nr:MFS transporter [Bradymonadales bacterium]